MSARLSGLLLRHRGIAAVGVHLTIVTLAYVLAFSLRFDFAIPQHAAWTLLTTLPLALVCKLLAFWMCGVFAGSWRYLNMRDVEDIVRACVLGSAMFLTSMVFFHGIPGFPRAVFLLDLVLCTGATTTSRLSVRWLRSRRERPLVRRIDNLVLIVGAGDAGVRLLEEIEHRNRLKCAVVGFIDDDPVKLGLRVGGTPVLGRIDDLPALVAEHEIGEVLVAMPSAPGAVLRKVVQHCRDAGVRSRVLPTLSELVEGRVMYTQMREVRVDDLLAREPVHLDQPRVRSFASGKRVLVTGAAGSIGSELCRQIAGYAPACLVLYDRHENGMYGLEMELRARFPEVRLEPVLGDILLPDQLAAVFSQHRPELVFHAAAYKHVPLAERNVLEAVRNNILGTRNVAEAAVAHGTREFVLVSTDKAVRPTSVMGVTKRIAEMVLAGMQDKQNGGCRFVAVRFGNVLGSSGSVVPLFREQIARGGPVTVTHPDVMRYFMTIPEAVQLILQAATLGEGGEIFVLEMGEPVRIVDLARNMIRLSGFEPDEDIEIVFTGLRPGEKMTEELVADEEAIADTHHDRICVLRRNIGAPRPETWLPEVERAVAADPATALRLLQKLVPAYRAGAHHGLDGVPPEREALPVEPAGADAAPAERRDGRDGRHAAGRVRAVADARRTALATP
ncbi:MAG TPA: nucleoside-diphosphate sugar epimerase/dehydratase [Candidatus Binatia bacterium]|jgi:FlaA1/EpsC-like NDP-sugar epimerase